MRDGATLQDVNDAAVTSAFWWYVFRLADLDSALSHPAGQDAAAAAMAAVAHDIFHSTPSEAAVKQVLVAGSTTYRMFMSSSTAPQTCTWLPSRDCQFCRAVGHAHLLPKMMSDHVGRFNSLCQVVWLVAASTWHTGADPVLTDMERMQRQEALGDGYVATVSNNWRLSVSLQGFAGL